MAEVVIHVRVTPGAARPRIGGRWGDQHPPRLLMAVRARAVDGAANRDVIDSIAAAWHVARAEVRVVSGSRSRSKSVAIEGDAAAVQRRFEELLAQE